MTSKKPPSAGFQKFKATLAVQAEKLHTINLAMVWLVRRWLPLRLFQLSNWLQTPVKFPKKLPRWFWLAVGIAVAFILAALFSPRPIAHSYYDQFRSLPLPVVTEVDKIEVEKVEINVTSTPGGSCPVLSLRYPNKTGIITRGYTSWHPGIDWTTNTIDIYSSSVGEVVFSGWEGEYGLAVFVDIPGTGYQLRYAHLSRSYVLPGQEVTVGEAIGVAGETGNASGVHLHQDLWCNGERVDFLKYFSR